MDSKIRALCAPELPYPEVRVERKNPAYARLLSHAYAGQNGELAAVLSYVYGCQTSRGKQPEILSDVLRCVAACEMRHLDMLGELITLLGGDPRFQAAQPRGYAGMNTAMMNYPREPLQILRGAVAGEEAAIRLYSELMRSIDDKYVREVLKRIILDEEAHLKVFKEMAG